MNTQRFNKYLASQNIDPSKVSEMGASEQSKLYAGFADSIYTEHKGELDDISADFNEMKDAYQKASEATAGEIRKLREAQQAQGIALSRGGGRNEQAQVKALADKVDKAMKGFQSARDESPFATISENEVKALRQYANKATFVSGDVSGNTDSYLLNEIPELPTRSVRFFDLFAGSAMTVPVDANGVLRYSDWDDATTVRNVQQIAEEGTFPESTMKYIERSKTLKKTGGSYAVTEESIYDRARFVQTFNQFMDTSMALVLDQQIYSGDGTGENHTGIFTSANTYTPAASGIADANIFDLLRVVRTNITSGFQKTFAPNMVAMHPTDIDKMLLKKDANNNYVRPDFFQINDGITNMYMVAGLAIIETNVVTPNTLLVGDSRFAEVYQEAGGFQMIRGYKTGDFETDLQTVKVRRRMLTLVREMHAGAFNKVTDITAALTTLAS